MIKPPPIIEASCGKIDMKNVLEAHELISVRKFSKFCQNRFPLSIDRSLTSMLHALCVTKLLYIHAISLLLPYIRSHVCGVI